MKFKILTRIVGTESSWWEEYDKETADPKVWAQETVARFNNTLRTGEKSRELLDVVVLDPRSSESLLNAEINSQVEASGHDWVKQNAITKIGKGKVYDEYKCTNCGVTAKRLGVSWPPIRDSKFKAKVYENCDTSKAHLQKLELS